MKTRIVITVLILLITNCSFAQEWKGLKVYQKETGNKILEEGHWLKKDRKRKSNVWKQANLFNLSKEDGFQNYKTISEICDFYVWFDSERKKQGHEIKWIGIAGIATHQLSNLDNFMIRVFIVHNKEVVNFANQGTKNVFEFAFPQLKEIYFSHTIIKGEAAKKWDATYGIEEQCNILDPLFKDFSPSTFNKLNRMVKGKGLYNFGVPEALKFEGNLKDCQARFNHGTHKLLAYYLSKSE